MRILLLSMPDAFEHTSTITMRFPNGALASLAGNVDPHHEVACADLVLAPRDDLAGTVRRLVETHRPDVLGLSIMTFQRRTAQRVAALGRRLWPAARLVVGGYDPSLAPAVYESAEWRVDAVVRGEGDITFRDLLRAWEAGREPVDVAGLAFRTAEGFVRTPARPVSTLSGDEIRPPRRDARVLAGYTFVGRPVDVVETSRGCTFDCAFCSIIEMRGRNFHAWPIARVVADIADAVRRGARAVFLVDDNITLDVRRFEQLCEAIVEAGLHHVDYLVQAMTSSIAAGGDRLARLMKRAGFRYVFLGVENVRDAGLQAMHAAAKNRRRGTGPAANASVEAIEALHRAGLYVVGGLIVGSPGDTRDDIEANLAFARRHFDWPYIQHPTPYPGTPMSRQAQARGEIASDRVEEYDGTTAVLRNAQLTAEEIEFLRWRAERWMKLRHFWPVLAHSPAFALRHGPAMLRHTFRGASWRSLVGLEDERAAFLRYREHRQAEREYLPAS